MVNLMEAAYLAIGFVVFVVTISIGGAVLAGVQATQYNTANASCTYALAQAGTVGCMTTAYNATNYGIIGVGNLAAQNGVIGTILGAVVILGLLLGAFAISRHE
jgi:hypothetical protein